MKKFCLEIKGLASALENPEALTNALAQHKETLDEARGFCERSGVLCHIDTLDDGTAGLVFRAEERMAQALARALPAQKIVDSEGSTLAGDGPSTGVYSGIRAIPSPR